MSTNQLPAPKPIEFALKINGEKITILLDPKKWDLIGRVIGDLRNYAVNERNYENHRFLLHIAGQIELLGMDLFSLDYQHESDQDWAKVLGYLLRSLAKAVNQKFYPPIPSMISGPTNDPSPRGND